MRHEKESFSGALAKRSDAFCGTAAHDCWEGCLPRSAWDLPYRLPILSGRSRRKRHGMCCSRELSWHLQSAAFFLLAGFFAYERLPVWLAAMLSKSMGLFGGLDCHVCRALCAGRAVFGAAGEKIPYILAMSDYLI